MVEDGGRLLATPGRTGKTPDEVLDLRLLLHPWEVCAPKKLLEGAKKRCSEVPSCVLCALSSLAHLASPCLGHQGEALFVFTPWGAVNMPVTALSWLT